jgi:choline monooxygenase
MVLERPNIDADLSRAATLPSAWYVDPTAARVERDLIFGHTWQLVAPLAKLAEAGSYVTAEVGGDPIVIVRDQDMRLKAFYNVCRHRGGPIARGEGKLKVFQCGYHGWLYGLDGALRNTPEFNDVQCFDKADHGLRPVAIDTWGTFVFARLSATGPTLAEWLGKIPAETAKLPLDRMQFLKRKTYEINCNWKVYVDNYLEGYHIPIVHPGLMREIDYAKYRVEVERFYSKQFAPVRSGKESLYKRNLQEGASPEALYYWVFPNLMLNIYPDNIQTNVIIPVGPDKTLTVFDWYFLDAERPEAAAEFAASLEFSHEVQEEDIMICEHVQKGLASRSYDTGRYSVQREAGLHHFHRLFAEFLGKGAWPS